MRRWSVSVEDGLSLRVTSRNTPFSLSSRTSQVLAGTKSCGFRTLRSRSFQSWNCKFGCIFVVNLQCDGTVENRLFGMIQRKMYSLRGQAYETQSC